MEGVGNDNSAARNAETRTAEARQAEQARPGPSDQQRGDLAGRVDATSNREAARVADQVTGGAQDKVEEAGLSKGQRQDPGGPHLKDGDFLHNPRALSPNQAKELEKLQNDPNVHPDTQKEIKEFLDDYKNKRDRLFPESPNPYPRPYPRTRTDEVV
jgi:hypothetical protein